MEKAAQAKRRMKARRTLTPLLLNHQAADTLVEMGGLSAVIGDIPQWCKRPDFETVMAGLPPLPGVRLVTWTTAAGINCCLRPYALLGLSLPGATRLVVTWTSIRLSSTEPCFETAK